MTTTTKTKGARMAERAAEIRAERAAHTRPYAIAAMKAVAASFRAATARITADEMTKWMAEEGMS